MGAKVKETETCMSERCRNWRDRGMVFKILPALLCWVCAAALPPACRAAADAAPAAPAGPARPNILYIMADDHASHALSAYGSKINKTPNLDRIAAGGMRFNNAFVTNALCGPSR